MEQPLGCFIGTDIFSDDKTSSIPLRKRRLPPSFWQEPNIPKCKSRHLTVSEHRSKTSFHRLSTKKYPPAGQHNNTRISKKDFSEQTIEKKKADDFSPDGSACFRMNGLCPRYQAQSVLGNTRDHSGLISSEYRHNDVGFRKFSELEMDFWYKDLMFRRFLYDQTTGHDTRYTVVTGDPVTRTSTRGHSNAYFVPSKALYLPYYPPFKKHEGLNR